MKTRIFLLLASTIALSTATFAQVRPVQNKQLEKATAEGQIIMSNSNLIGVWQASPFVKFSDTTDKIASKFSMNQVAASVPNSGTFSNGTATITSPNGSSFNIGFGSYWIPLSQKAAVNGVASLGADGKVPSSQLPAQSVADVFVVSSRSAMLALVATQGDIAVRTDSSVTYVLQQGPPTDGSNWILLPTGASITSVNGQSGPAVTLTTDNISEGATNKYFTTAAARTAISGSASWSYNNSTGIGSLPLSGVTPGSYNNVTVNDKGIITSASNVAYLTSAALGDYYTKLNLQTPGQAIVDFANVFNVPANIALTLEKQESTGTTSSTITLSYTPKFPSAIDVKLNGVSMQNADYALSGTTLTLGFTRTSSDYVTIHYAR